MSDAEGQTEAHSVDNAGGGCYAVIAGYGLPGRAMADELAARGVPFCVIELNTDTVRRCTRGGVNIIYGDAAREDVLRQAGIERATLFAATMPNDAAVIEAVGVARRVNPRLKIWARCEYVSNGIKATRRGADEVVVAERAVAHEFERLVQADAMTQTTQDPTDPPTPREPQPLPPPRPPQPQPQPLPDPQPPPQPARV